MSGASRRKGVAGEREVAQAFEAIGVHVRGLEGGGDHLAIWTPDDDRRSFVLHIEVKRQERLRLPEWLEQARTEAPPGVPPLVCFRQNRGEWYAALPLGSLLELIA
jgi:hypothetical protein